MQPFAILEIEKKFTYAENGRLKLTQGVLQLNKTLIIYSTMDYNYVAVTF